MEPGVEVNKVGTKQTNNTTFQHEAKFKHMETKTTNHSTFKNKIKSRIKSMTE
jgi:hypothetical protein